MTPPAWAAWIAFAAVVFSGVQAIIALRKLRLDLFSKRFETWEAINDAIETWRDVTAKVRIENLLENEEGEARRRFWRLRRQMSLLFPPEVTDCLNRIEETFHRYLEQNLDQIHPPIGPARAASVIAKTKAVSDTASQLYQMQDELLLLAHRHMRQYGMLETHFLPLVRQSQVAARRLLDRAGRRDR